MDELVDIVSHKGRATHQASKHEAHENGWLHKTVIGYLKSGQTWTLVQQSADRQDPGQFVAPVGGHVKAGETELEALRREAKEEIGADNISHKFIGKVVYRRTVIGRDENHYFYIYEIDTDDPIILGDEAVAHKSFTEQELLDAHTNRQDDFGDSYYFVIEKFYPHLLPTNWIKKY